MADQHITQEQWAELAELAAAMRGRAYAPYSHYTVGAALLAADGTVYTGCNVENASFGLTICAERNAVVHAVASGSRDFVAIAVATVNGVSPCGACRQVLAEFNPRLPVLLVDADGNRQELNLSQLLPYAFVPEQLAPRDSLG